MLLFNVIYKGKCLWYLILALYYIAILFIKKNFSPKYDNTIKT